MNDLTTNVSNLIDQSASHFATTLTQYKWDLLPDSQLQAAKKALSKSDYIMKIACGDVRSVHDALIQAAVLGLDLTEGKKQGWLLPRRTQRKDSNGKDITSIVLQVGYKGVEAIHQNMGVIDRLAIRTIRENDAFEWSGNDQEKPVHAASTDKTTPNWFATDEERGPIAGAFAITYYPDDTIGVTVASISNIFEKHRDRSDSYKKYMEKVNAGKWAHEPPWVSDEQAMVEKTMAYIAAKQWPANIRDNDLSSKILETLHETDVSDYSLQFTQKERDAFYDFIEKDDSLGMFLFSRRMDVEGYTALFNTFPKGTKTERKSVVREMEGTGSKQMMAVTEAIADSDAGKLQENMEGCMDVTAKLVKAALDPIQKTAFDELMGELSDQG